MNYIVDKEIYHINSAKRITGSASDFYFKLNIDRNKKFDHVVVLSASIPKSYYLVSNFNKSFTLKEDTNSVLITFPIGNYTRRSLASTLETLLNDNSPNGYTYSVTFQNISLGNDNGKYTINVSGNGSVQPEFIFTNEMYEQMGFDINSTNTFSNNSLTSADVINLTNETTLFIYSDICQNHNEGILQEIFTSGDISYSYINFKNHAPYEYSKKMVLSKGDTYLFRILDENGKIVDTNGINVNITLMLFKKNNIDNLIKGAIKFLTLSSE